MWFAAAGIAALTVWDGARPAVRFDYANFTGMTVAMAEVPLVTGSGFQYYERGWTKGYYSSAWKPMSIERQFDGRVQVRYTSDDGEAAGTHLYTPTENGFEVDYQYRWRGKDPVMLEAAFARVWAPVLAKGRLELNGGDVGPLDRPVSAGTPVEHRMIGRPARKMEFKAPFGTFLIESDKPVSVMDARNYSIEWADGHELFWIGVQNVEIKPQETVSFKVRYTILPRPGAAANPKEVVANVSEVPNALVPTNRRIPLLPKPKSLARGSGAHPLRAEIVLEGDDSLKEFRRDLEELLWVRWDRRSFEPTPGQTVVNVRVGNLGLKAEGYQVEVSPASITVVGQDRDGVRHGLRTLAALAESRGGQLEFPAVTVTDYPTLGWRGVHNFVGPTALDFQTKLMQRVLAPMKLNKMVVQCERTNFEAIRGTETAITMDKGDLATLFDRYREHGIEPIPLVQSLGHAGWIFENGQNLDIAINPNVPFTMDPRKARTRQLLTDLWKEVVETTKAKTVHFGMDEISNRGLPDDPSFTTRIWRQHVPFLNGLARDMGVGKMMWGDIMLHPSEAPDAAHAKTLESARERRAVLERGTYIADWHYKDDSRPETFKSLEVWKNAGMRPIASTWFRPNNIRGFALAAARADAGLLQTTWAGYESSEANMIRAFPQFSAYLLAADYAWSGRTELPKDLGYDPEEVLQAMYFSAPQAVKPMPGRKILLEGSEGRERQIGPYRFRIDRPVQLKGVTEDAAFFAPNELTVNVRAQARQVVLVVDTLARLREMTDVAEVRVLTTGGIYRATMAYGSHVRAVTDPRSSMVSPREAGLSAFVVDIPNEVTVEAVVVEVKNRAAGLRVHGVTVL